MNTYDRLPVSGGINETAVMNSTHFCLIFLVSCSILTVRGFNSRVPRRSNEVLYPEQQLQKPGVAKYVDGKHLSSAWNSSRRLHGRHVCTQSKVVMVPVKDMQSYCKPMYQSYLRRCDKEGKNGFCTGYRVVYELAYRSVQILMPKTESLQACCPGWTQTQISAADCKKAICREPCRNGGICTKPDHCTCPPGWTGKTCESDLNECSRKTHSCEHECVNLQGSYRCLCKEGFLLQDDRKSCKKIDSMIKSENNLEVLKEVEAIRQRLAALEEWKHRYTTEGSDSRQPREDRINSLSEQIAIIEETLEEYKKKKRQAGVPIVHVAHLHDLVLL